MRLLLILFITLSISQSWAEEAVKHGFTPEQEAWMAEQNEQSFVSRELLDEPDNILTFDLLNTTTVRAFAEFEDAGYLIFSSSYSYQSKSAKLTMAQNLPKDVTLVVYTHNKNYQNIKSLKAQYADLLEQKRLKIIYLPNGGNSFWARDGIPVPVWRQDNQYQQIFTVVDAVYYHYFEADYEVSQYFNAKTTKHNYYYEGGNFMANTKNECLVVNKPATAKMPDNLFKQHYGCEKLVRLPFIKGIGHADESVKYIDDTTVMTDAPEYKTILENAGYDVVMLPRPYREYETYVNSLLVNGVIYVPIFGTDRDEQALQIYRDQGFDKVIGINSYSLSNNGLGSLHCITMTYPKVPFNEFLEELGGEEM